MPPVSTVAPVHGACRAMHAAALCLLSWRLAPGLCAGSIWRRGRLPRGRSRTWSATSRGCPSASWVRRAASLPLSACDKAGGSRGLSWLLSEAPAPAARRSRLLPVHHARCHSLSACSKAAGSRRLSWLVLERSLLPDDPAVFDAPVKSVRLIEQKAMIPYLPWSPPF